MATDYAHAVERYATALRMIEDAVGELFGPLASLPSQDDVPLPTPEISAEVVIEAPKRVESARRVAS